MKIDRLLGIITVLLQNNKATAPELAEKFEVSRRTILRDIDDICKAGIPVVTSQGGGGGISIAEGYSLDKSVLTSDELQSILAGLKSLGSVSDTPRIERLISKLSPKNEAVISLKDSIIIDLSSHYKSSLSEKIRLIKEGIQEKRILSFDYYSERSKSARNAEPCILAFKWTAWYMLGYCRNSNDFRLFKLNRLWNLKVLHENFDDREIPEEKLDFGGFLTDTNTLKAVFHRSVEYILVEEYGPDSYKTLEDGRLELTVGYTNREFMIRWLLGFGDKVIVTHPNDLAEEIKQRAKNILAGYEHDI